MALPVKIKKNANDFLHSLDATEKEMALKLIGEIAADPTGVSHQQVEGFRFFSRIRRTASGPFSVTIRYKFKPGAKYVDIHSLTVGVVFELN